MRGCDHHMVNDVICFHGSGWLAFTTAFLGDVVADRLGFGIARAWNSQHNGLFRNQIRTAKVTATIDDLGFACIAKIITDLD